MVSLSPTVRKLYPFEGKFLTLDGGVKLHYLDEGQGETLLFVHGNPTWSFIWRKLVQEFSGQYRCIALDHVGCGLSDKPQEYSYTFAQHVENAAKLVETLDLKNVTLVVHDWGGPIGFGAAVKLPDRFARFVIFNTGIFEGPIPLEIRMCRWPVVGKLAIRGLNGFVRGGLLRATSDRSKFKNGVAEGYLAPYDSWENRVANLRFIEDIPLEAAHPTREYFLDVGEKIRQFADKPVVILWGEKDFCFVPVYRKMFLERLPKAEVHVFEDAAHWVVEDAHDRIVPIVRSFLERNPLAQPVQA